MGWWVSTSDKNWLDIILQNFEASVLIFCLNIFLKTCVIITWTSCKDTIMVHCICLSVLIRVFDESHPCTHKFLCWWQPNQMPLLIEPYAVHKLSEYTWKAVSNNWFCLIFLNWYFQFFRFLWLFLIGCFRPSSGEKCIWFSILERIFEELLPPPLQTPRFIQPPLPGTLIAWAFCSAQTA